MSLISHKKARSGCDTSDLKLTKYLERTVRNVQFKKNRPKAI